MGDYEIGIGVTRDQVANLLVWEDEFLAPVQASTAGKISDLYSACWANSENSLVQFALISRLCP